MMDDKRGDVIQAVKQCLRRNGCSDCGRCPYTHVGDGLECRGQLRDDIIALLKAQEARVVTTADFENNPNLDDSYHLNVWEEYRDGTRCGWNTININHVRAFTDIRRYWTSRPTDEQREAVKWNE